VTGDSLELRGLDSLERVGQAIPNLVITGGGGGTSGTSFTVRGIPNVGTYVDGVWQVGTRVSDAGIRGHRPHRGAGAALRHTFAATRPAVRSAFGRRSRRKSSAPT